MLREAEFLAAKGELIEFRKYSRRVFLITRKVMQLTLAEMELKRDQMKQLLLLLCCSNSVKHTNLQAREYLIILDAPMPITLLPMLHLLLLRKTTPNVPWRSSCTLHKSIEKLFSTCFGT